MAIIHCLLIDLKRKELLTLKTETQNKRSISTAPFSACLVGRQARLATGASQSEAATKS